MPFRSSLLVMAQMVRDRRISPVELVDAHLRQIDAQNPRLNAFVCVLAEQAREAARRSETAVMKGETAHGEPLGLLHGVPVTVKDSFDMVGLPTYCGSKFRADHIAARDSTSAARLLAAGAIILGKTNAPEFLNMYETEIGDPGYAEKDYARYTRATAADVLGTARKVLDPNARVVLRVVPETVSTKGARR